MIDFKKETKLKINDIYYFIGQIIRSMITPSNFSMNICGNRWPRKLFEMW